MMLLAALLLQTGSAGPIMGPLIDAQKHFSQAGCTASIPVDRNEVKILCESKDQFRTLRRTVPSSGRYFFTGAGSDGEGAAKRYLFFAQPY